MFFSIFVLRSAQQHAEEMAGVAASGVTAHFSHEGAMERFTRSGEQYFIFKCFCKFFSIQPKFYLMETIFSCEVY